MSFWEKVNEEIVVLGNGFDLSCGLKSRYSDFFGHRFHKLFGSKTNYDDIRLKIKS